MKAAWSTEAEQEEEVGVMLVEDQTMMNEVCRNIN